MKNDRVLPYVIVVGIVAIVAIVTLFLCSGRVEGAAIREYVEEDQATCLDDDPLDDFYKGGTLRFGKIQYEDYCLNGRLLYQHYCRSGQVRLHAPYECPNGCLNGACIK